MTSTPEQRIKKPCWNCGDTAYSSAPAGNVTEPIVGTDMFVCDSCGMVYMFRNAHE